MTSTMTPQMIADLFMHDERYYAATSPTYRDDLRASLNDPFDNDLERLIDSYIDDMRDDDAISCTCLPNDRACYCPNLFDLANALTSDEYDALITLLCTFYSDILAS